MSQYSSHISYAPRMQSSPLEHIAQSAVNYSPATISSPVYASPVLVAPVTAPVYSTEQSMSTAYSLGNPTYQLFQTKQEYQFKPDTFLKPGKAGIFVGRAEEIKEYINEAFEKTMGKLFPADLKISILSEKQFRAIAPNSSTIGLSINRSEHGLLSEIFVLNDTLGRVMLTIGHEIGHTLTTPLASSIDEEAKAFAFSLAWMKTIKEHDIANLGDAIILENPAHNGLHDVAFDFVMQKQKQGLSAWDIYEELVGRVA